MNTTHWSCSKCRYYNWGPLTMHIVNRSFSEAGYKRVGFDVAQVIKIVRHFSFNCHLSAKIEIPLMRHRPKWCRQTPKRKVDLLNMQTLCTYLATVTHMAWKVKFNIKFTCKLLFLFGLRCVLFSNFIGSNSSQTFQKIIYVLNSILKVFTHVPNWYQASENDSSVCLPAYWLLSSNSPPLPPPPNQPAPQPSSLCSFVQLASSDILLVNLILPTLTDLSIAFKKHSAMVFGLVGHKIRLLTGSLVT